MTATSSRSGTARRRKSKRRRLHLEAERPPLPAPPSGAAASSSSAADLGAEADRLAREYEPEAELEEAAQILQQRAGAGAEQEAPPPPPPTPGAPAPSGPDPVELGARIHMVTFTLLAARLGPHWELSPAEQKLVGETCAPLLAALMARVSGLAINLTMYGVVLVSLLVPRLQQDAELEREREAKKSQPEGGHDGREADAGGRA